ncbi:MAG TPA: hypothetical protein VGO61_05610 [Steroidobacteraceae bacterium]|jgi:hypothetical protein|nr:hypothetical protein [Steroidobacteraceae bacterium]
MSLRRMLLGLLVTGFFTVASAADKQVTLEGGDTLTMRWGADWVVGDTPPQSPFGTLTIHGADAAQWRLTLAPLPPHPTLTGDVGNLRIYVRNMSRGLENGGVDVDQEQKSLEGNAARGFYFKARDVRPKTKAQIKAVGGDYTDTYTGALSINSRAYLFEVVWTKGGETAANAALAALKTVRIQ